MTSTLGAVGVSGILRAQAVEAELHVIGGEIVAIVEFHARSQLERVGQAVIGDVEAFGQLRIGLGIGVERHQRRIDLLDHDMRHAAGSALRIEAGRIGRERGDQGAAGLGRSGGGAVPRPGNGQGRSGCQAEVEAAARNRRRRARDEEVGVRHLNSLPNLVCCCVQLAYGCQ
jgi:hypothetical protein